MTTTAATAQPKTKAKPKASYYYKLFRVKRGDGRVTTVSMDPILVTRACQLMGIRTVGQLVRQTAFEYQDGMGKNCSGYVAQQLREATQRALEERSAQRNAEAAAAAATA